MYVNPLDYSQYSTLNLVDILRNSIAKLGFSADKMGSLDQHSTICISFYDTPDIMLSITNDRLWIWSLLNDLNETLLYAKSNQILTLLLEPIPGVEGNQLMLGLGNNGYELKGLININHIEQENGLASIIEKFHHFLTKIQ